MKPNNYDASTRNDSKDRTIPGNSNPDQKEKPTTPDQKDSPTSGPDRK